MSKIFPSLIQLIIKHLFLEKNLRHIDEKKHTSHDLSKKKLPIHHHHDVHQHQYTRFLICTLEIPIWPIQYHLCSKIQKLHIFLHDEDRHSSLYKFQIDCSLINLQHQWSRHNSTDRTHIILQSWDSRQFN